MTDQPIFPLSILSDFVRESYAQGQRDMLAKCITLIEESVPWSTENWIAVDERAAILTALRALQEDR